MVAWSPCSFHIPLGDTHRWPLGVWTRNSYYRGAWYIVEAYAEAPSVMYSANSLSVWVWSTSCHSWLCRGVVMLHKMLWSDAVVHGLHAARAGSGPETGLHVWTSCPSWHFLALCIERLQIRDLLCFRAVCITVVLLRSYASLVKWAFKSWLFYQIQT